MLVQSIIPNKQERIIELERLLAVAKAKTEQFDVRTKTIQHEAQAASAQAAELRQRIEVGEKELSTVKAAPAEEWEAAHDKLQVIWDDVYQRLDHVAAGVQKALDN